MILKETHLKQFEELGLSKAVLRAVKEKGYKAATDIQAKTIPLIMDGKDVIGRSQTGTGKTAAFAIPAVECASASQRKRTQVLVLCPTRELAMQIQGEMRDLYRHKEGVRAVAVYGGQSFERQLLEIKRGAAIVVGTPGRILDHIRRHTLKLEYVKLAVLDEADEMLNMGFRDDIEAILDATPDTRQTVLFSATMPQEILAITNRYQREPELVGTEEKASAVRKIEQSYCMVPNNKKMDALLELIEKYAPKRAIVFCNTKRMTDKLTKALGEKDISCAALHGDMRQGERTRTMDAFKQGRVRLLVATDVAARGIDAKNVDIVFNYDLPQNKEYYLHRIGRTGRAGKDGRAVTVIGARNEIGPLKDIIRATGSEAEIETLTMSSEADKMPAGRMAARGRGKPAPKAAPVKTGPQKNAPQRQGEKKEFSRSKPARRDGRGPSRGPSRGGRDTAAFYSDDECIFLKKPAGKPAGKPADKRTQPAKNGRRQGKAHFKKDKYPETK